MTRRHFARLAGFAGLSAPGFSPAAAPAPWSRSEPHMGCLWTLTLPDTPPGPAASAASAVFAEIARLNSVFSDYEPSSELNLLCDKAGQAPVPVSPELFAILSTSQEMAALSGGLFDITLAPCIRLWRRSRRRGELPDPDLLAKARALTGYRNLVLDPAGQTARLARPGMKLDLGGIAKGWTQDACVRLLQEKSDIQAFLLDAAGQVAAGAPPPGQEAWRVGLAGFPDPPPVLLRDGNVATSGDLHQSVEIDGVTYSHIMDPRTGFGSTVSRQASVIAATGALSDPLATLLCLLPEPEAVAWLATHFPRAQALLRGRQFQRTPGFGRFP